MILKMPCDQTLSSLSQEMKAQLHSFLVYWRFLSVDVSLRCQGNYELGYSPSLEDVRAVTFYLGLKVEACAPHSARRLQDGDLSFSREKLLCSQLLIW